MTSPAWLKQEQDELRIIKWENFQSGASADAVQDNTPSSAMSGKSTGIKSLHTFLQIYIILQMELHPPVFSCLTCRKPASKGAADHHEAPVHAGEQTGAHRCSGETGGGPDAGPQVPEDPDRKPHE